MDELNTHREVLENVGIKVAEIDSERKVVQLSPPLQMLFFGEEAIDKKKCFSAFGESCECTQCPLKDGELRKKRIERKGRYFEYTVFPVVDNEGKVQLAFATFVEITDRVMMEKELEKCSQELKKERGKKKKNH